MRTLLRILFGLMFLVGILLGIVYPLAARHVAGYEIGRWRVFERDAGFSPAEAMLSPADAPVFVAVEIEADGPLRAGEGRSVMTVTATNEGEKTVYFRHLAFAAQGTRESPQARTLAYREEPGMLEEADGRHVFVFAAGRDMDPAIRTADLLLNAGAFDLDPRAEPSGYTLMALGLVGFFMTLRRGTPKAPRPPKWGRGGGSA